LWGVTKLVMALQTLSPTAIQEGVGVANIDDVHKLLSDVNTVTLKRRTRAAVLGVALIAALAGAALATIPDANGQGTIVRRAEFQNQFNNWSRVTVTASCPSGFYVIGGGGRVVNSSTVGPNSRDHALRGSFPFENGWRVEAQAVNPSTARWAVRVWAICSNA